MTTKDLNQNKARISSSLPPKHQKGLHKLEIKDKSKDGICPAFFVECPLEKKSCFQHRTKPQQETAVWGSPILSCGCALLCLLTFLMHSGFAHNASHHRIRREQLFLGKLYISK